VAQTSSNGWGGPTWSCRFIGDTLPVLIMGPMGAGKSHVAQALGHWAAGQRHADAGWRHPPVRASSAAGQVPAASCGSGHQGR
jgi:hypothetical protein